MRSFFNIIDCFVVISSLIPIFYYVVRSDGPPEEGAGASGTRYICSDHRCRVDAIDFDRCPSALHLLLISSSPSHLFCSIDCVVSLNSYPMYYIGVFLIFTNRMLCRSKSACSEYFECCGRFEPSGAVVST